MVTTRSATKSPRGANSPRATGRGNAPATPSPRKQPECKTCGLPRLGHPRARCNIGSPPKSHVKAAVAAPGTPTETDTGSDLSSIEEPSSQLSRGMSSMNLDAPPSPPPAPRSSGRRKSAPLVPEDTKAAKAERRRAVKKDERARRQSVQLETAPSLTPSQDGLLEQLGKPKHWQEVLEEAKPAPLSRVMPGELMNPFSSQQSEAEQAQSQHLSQGSSFRGDHSGSSQHGSSFRGEHSAAGARRAPRPVQRTMSMEEQEVFVASVARDSRAHSYVIPKEDMARLQERAKGVRFHTRIVPLDHDDVCLIVGRHEADVVKLYEQTKTKQRTGGKVGALTGGMMVGAVGTFAGLAYS
ncbi:hypothetical protein HDZ31DRAFT_65337 [Schizophyllum fasciatum]